MRCPSKRKASNKYGICGFAYPILCCEIACQTYFSNSSDCRLWLIQSFICTFLGSIYPSKLYLRASSHHISERIDSLFCSFTSFVALINVGLVPSGNREHMNSCKSSSRMSQPSFRETGSIPLIVPDRNHLRTLSIFVVILFSARILNASDTS